VRWLIALGAAWMLALTLQPARADDLKPAAGVELVRGHCSACHALDLVASQRGDRSFWLKLIRWMQAEQNLWPIPAEQEEAILTYLAEQYGESAWSRRPPLAADLMPK
jgi:mono/diheme cytochrome c family protein